MVWLSAMSGHQIIFRLVIEIIKIITRLISIEAQPKKIVVVVVVVIYAVVVVVVVVIPVVDPRNIPLKFG